MDKVSDLILQKLKREGVVVVSDKLIHEAPEFLKQFEVTSLNSLFLVLNGNRPETRIDYDKVVFYEWCAENRIDVQYEVKERVYSMSLKENQLLTPFKTHL